MSFLRGEAVVYDKHGIDPLLDKIVPKLRSITRFSYHEVQHSEKGAPDLISFSVYGREDFWWHIMAYNGICRWSSIVEGMILKIPEFGSIIDINNRVHTERSTIREVEI